MDEKRMKYLLDRLAMNMLTEQEKLEVEAWYDSFDQLDDDLHVSHLRRTDGSHIAQRIWARILKRTQYETKFKLPYRWAAVITLLLVSAIIGIAYRSVVYQQVIAMTSKTIEVPEGKMMIVDLPDGSKVWIRSGSILSYNRFFLGDQRNVALDGEAFFDVQKNPNKPFVVHSGAWETRVLGTSFNVKALLNLDIYEVMVRTGKVQISDSSAVLATLLPGGRISRRDERIDVDETQVAQYLQWREGGLIFDNSSMAEIAWYLQNRFDLQVEIEGEHIQHFPFSGDFTGLSFSQILKIMQEVYPFEVQELTANHYLIREVTLAE
ncbi:FecR domain-containing protein [Reichenbachiella agarivorans]|uniref:FecR domain-containing protein n=1 Tax=Reichenbachiella agarivorans TaxID=2979464 RepID=A0ABY6CN63_9BACT|nr:FecR domain-containing protein [Reichenbachiella agarivorans]UXP31957.1 FecR domain-containing protein [Reichenbachiella agarivorans]